ncbi:MAG: DUF6800 family protein [Planctomycetota bacterium]
MLLESFASFTPTPSYDMAGSERQRELRRRRKRKANLTEMKAKLDKASPSDKAEMARKLRLMTPGAEDLIVRWGLEER